MKTMNYFLLMGLLIFGSSCTNYSPLGNDGSEGEPDTYYLELDFYQASLTFEDEQLKIEMMAIREEIEGGNTERQGRLEEIQTRLGQIERNTEWNEDLLRQRPIIGGGGGGGPRCVPVLDDLRFRPCPMPRAAIERFFLAAEQWEKGEGTIELLDENEEVVGGMVGMSEVPESDGFFLKAEIEYDRDLASIVRITNLDVEQSVRVSEYRLE